MKLTLLLLIAGCLQVCAKGYSQTISLSLKNARLETVFDEVEKQAGYSFVYRDRMMQAARPVTIQVKQATIEDVLQICFKGQPFTYSIVDKTIILKEKEPGKENLNTPIEVRGRVTNENGDPVPGATVQVKGSQTATTTDASGEFTLSNVNADDILVISGAEIKPQEISVAGRTYITARINAKVGELDQVVMMAYGQTTRRLTTGNISKVTAEEISRQPVSNPLAALQGRVPGMMISQTSGVPGAALNIQIQGQQSLGAKGNTIIVSNDPLIVVDGVPFDAGGSVLNQLISAAGNPRQGFGLSPLNLINPADIESIEVLKDAAATSIYGSRGANGVVLITTKKGQAGAGRLSMNIYTGFSRVTRTTPMLNTQQYMQMRLEAISNDGGTINNSSFLVPGYAPDLLAWDTTAYTDWKKYFIGGTARTSDLQLSYSGGTQNTQYLIGMGAHTETTVFPGSARDSRVSTRFNLSHRSPDKKLSVVLSAMYSADINRLIGTDLTAYINMPPILPGLTDETGKLKWEHNGVPYSAVGMNNPLADVNQKYEADSRTLMSNLTVGYQLFKGLTVKTAFGYNTISADETKIFPAAFKNPGNNPTGSSDFGHRRIESWIIEPQAEYSVVPRLGKLSFLIGGTFQKNESSSETIQAAGYTNDALLYSIAAAPTLSASGAHSEYKYNAVFGRVSYNRDNKYLLDLSGRRDGSSRFGPGKQFANFFAAGAGWIFTEEKFLKKPSRVLSYGKIKLSYGTTGNDQIGDYKFMSTWTANAQSYQQVPSLVPLRLANADFAWELNRKLQGGMDLGFLDDRILVSAVFFRNRTGNQLVNYPLPAQTGFSSLGAMNIPAVIQNTGLEVTLNTKNISNKYFQWVTSFNLTVPRNKLISYPELNSSSYTTTYVIGQSLNVIYSFDFLGVDPATGVYQFRDVNGDGNIGTSDYVVSGNTDPKYYGGLVNDLSFKGFNLNFLFEFRNQVGPDYRRNIVSNPPGSSRNQPLFVLQRWQKPGDVSEIQRFTSYYASPAFTMLNTFAASNQAYENASFVRLRNASISYRIPRLTGIKSARIFLQGQNLWTFTNYKGSDPENQHLFRLPLMRTFTGGIHLTF